ncbi:hypothetical protein SLEP1_g55374 [Rubroshorea leprosula]|uniref:Uncharacterized protein n=1 Tax=Rubroshorea leprosula TaxID=152421 RepID=A0AAV5MG42_9ROSI|nr:hypothetical protein SLEP1_g55374 [Rubroshorea leprosula]
MQTPMQGPTAIRWGPVKEACMERCKDYYREKKKREGEDPHDFSMEYSGKKLTQCMAQCERTAEEVRQICPRRCEQKWGREAEEGGDGNTKEKKEKKEEEEEEEDSNPYVFENEHFDVKIKSVGGSVFLLPKFTDRSNLLRVVENHRLGVLVVYPDAFVVQTTWMLMLCSSLHRGTVSLILENKRESFNVDCGDLFRIPPGTPVYLINRDENEKHYVVNLIQTINDPGQCESRWEERNINFRCTQALSWNILEAALKTSRDQLERLFMRQDKGRIFGESREQIKALSHHEKGGSAGGSIWPFGGESRDAFNLLNQRPSMSNNYGELFEAD